MCVNIDLYVRNVYYLQPAQHCTAEDSCLEMTLFGKIKIKYMCQSAQIYDTVFSLLVLEIKANL